MSFFEGTRETTEQKDTHLRYFCFVCLDSPFVAGASM